MRKVRSLLVLTVALVGAYLPLGNSAGAAVQRVDYIITFAPSANPRAEVAAITKAQGKIFFTYEHALNGVAVNLPTTAINGLRNRPGIAAIEVDAPVSISATQTGATWGLDRIDQRARPVNGSYNYPDVAGTGVNAYIIDTGILGSHSEFAGRMSSDGYTAIADGNGTTDCNGHGTHVAGTVGGSTYGVAKKVSLIPVRVLDCGGSGTNSGVIAGVDWARNHHQAGVPAVANMSLGGGASAALDNAVANLVADGVVVAVAAGNSNRDACNFSPARTASALTVGATTSTDARASYSNFGRCLDIFAPGSSITSAWSNGGTNTISGTSMASPHVAGVAALVLSANPALTVAEVSGKIVGQSTTNVVSSAGKGSPNRLLYSLVS